MARPARRPAGSHIRELMAHTDEGMLAVAPSGLVCVLNERAQQLLGVDRRDLLGKPVSLLRRPELVGALIEALRAIELFTFECRIEDRVLQCTVASYQETSGRGAVLTLRDRTSVSQERRRATAVLSSSGDGLVVFDGEGRITFVNPAAERMLGRESSDLIRGVIDLWALFGGEEREGVGDSYVKEVCLRHPEQHVIEVRWDPVLGEEGERMGHVATLRDVTAEREVGRMKNEFVSTVSHELRTPLTSIKGYIDLILEGEAGEVNDIQREFLSIVKDNTDRLVELINDMLDISRIESGRMVLKVEAVDLAERIAGALDTFRTVFEQQSRVVRIEMAEDLPLVAGDPDRIGQILVNLISNALKYSPGGGDIEIRAERSAETVRVSITDHGIGIEKEDLPKLFTKFFRIDSSLTRQIGGTGLGLSIVKSIVELLGGEVGLESEPGVGSTFWFTLPVASPALVRTPDFEPPLGSPGGTVLVIDDSEECTNLVYAYLSGRGYRVIRASTVDEGWRRASAEKPDAITIDVTIEDGRGFELLRQLKAEQSTKDIPVVVLSIACEEGRSQRLGATGYLEKPIERERLLAAIDRLTGSIDSPVVLVVDDDRGTVDVLSRTLRGRGFAVIAAYDGLEALAAVKHRMPSLILLDLRMPAMDGYEVISALKDDPETRDIPIVVMTAYHLDEERAHILELATEHVSKPLDTEAFVQRIEAVLGGGVGR